MNGKNRQLKQLQTVPFDVLGKFLKTLTNKNNPNTLNSPSPASNESRAPSQMSLFLAAKEQYGIDKFILSSWSPPYSWKTMKVPYGRVGASINRLTYSNYQKFAQYIVNYIDYCKKNGIDIYAISPQNGKNLTF